MFDQNFLQKVKESNDKNTYTYVMMCISFILLDESNLIYFTVPDDTYIPICAKPLIKSCPNYRGGPTPFAPRQKY